MASGGVITLFFTGDLSGLEASLGRAGAAVESTASKMKAAGGALTTGLSLPLAAVGIAASKTAANFDREMTKIQTLVGVNEDKVNSWRKEIRAMSGDVGRGPGELARALFVVTSAGERTGEALKIVEQAAKASAVGLGDTATIARAITAAMTAYGKENLSAAEATEVLLGTVREGNLEASELAGVLGRVIPLAAQMGVEFGQVGGFLAAFTRLGVNAQEAVTALRGTLSAALKPASDSAKALEEVGSSSAILRREIQEKGLAAALLGLVDKFKGNDVALARVIPNVRALAGVLGVTGSQAEQFEQIVAALTGELNELPGAFEATTKTASFQFDQLKTQFEEAGIALGNQLLPGLISVANAMEPMLRNIGVLADKFGSLPQSVKTAGLGFLGFLAIVGPFTIALGGLLAAMGKIVSTMALVAGAAAKVGAALAAIGIAGLGPAVLGVAAGLGVLAAALGVGFLGLAALSGETSRLEDEMHSLAVNVDRDWTSMRAAWAKGFESDSEITAEISAVEKKIAELKEKIAGSDTGSVMNSAFISALGAQNSKIRALLGRRADLIEGAKSTGQLLAELDSQIALAEGNVERLTTAMNDAKLNEIDTTAYELGLALSTEKLEEYAIRRDLLLNPPTPEAPDIVPPSAAQTPDDMKDAFSEATALQIRLNEVSIRGDEMSLQSHRAYLQRRYQLAAGTFGAETELALDLADDLHDVNEQILQDTEASLINERALQQQQTAWLLQTGQLSADGRIAQIDQLLAAEENSAERILDLNREKFSLIDSMAQASVQAASALGDQSTAAQIEMLEAIKAELLTMGPVYAHMASQIAGEIEKAKSAAVAEAKTMGDELNNSGKEIANQFVDGFFNGAMDARSMMKKAMSVLVKIAVNLFMKKLGIASPSKVAAGWGHSIGDGLVMGLDKSGGSVNRATNRLVGAVLSAGPDSARALSVAYASGLSSAIPVMNAASAGGQGGVGDVRTVTEDSVDIGEVINNLDPSDPLLAARRPELQRFFAETLYALKGNGFKI
tara:strand:- start:9564 stop:12620 length:3057 start_codon:yes stop_codon:yes gene_type:complete